MSIGVTNRFCLECFSAHVLSTCLQFFWLLHLETQLLDHTVILCLAFQEATKLIFRGTDFQSAGFKFFHNLVNTYYFPFSCFSKRYFCCEPFLKFYWICYNITSVLCLFFWLQGTWDLSSPTRDRTLTLALKGKVLTTVPPGKSLCFPFCWLLSFWVWSGDPLWLWSPYPYWCWQHHP